MKKITQRRERKRVRECMNVQREERLKIGWKKGGERKMNKK